MYAKPLSFLVGSINLYRNIFYQVDLLPWITTFYPTLFKLVAV